MRKMQISKNFNLSEFTKSGFADKYGIDNTPDPISKANICRLVNEVLQPIRDEFGESIIINSCYRCERVNRGVGGSKNSDHKYGCAADIRTESNLLHDNMRLWNCIMQMVNDGKIKCRQIVFEHGRRSIGPQWIHISINHDNNPYKENQILYIK